MPEAEQRPDELVSLFTLLEKQVYIGRMYLWVWRDLSKALARNPDLGQQAPFFFTFTLRAFINESFLHLSRLFDKTSGVVNLRRILKFIDQKALRFTKTCLLSTLEEGYCLGYAGR